MIKCDTNFDHGSNFKVANKKFWDLDLISKLNDWNLKILKSEDVYLR